MLGTSPNAPRIVMSPFVAPPPSLQTGKGLLEDPREAFRDRRRSSRPSTSRRHKSPDTLTQLVQKKQGSPRATLAPGVDQAESQRAEHATKMRSLAGVNIPVLKGFRSPNFNSQVNAMDVNAHQVADLPSVLQQQGFFKSSAVAADCATAARSAVSESVAPASFSASANVEAQRGPEAVSAGNKVKPENIELHAINKLDGDAGTSGSRSDGRPLKDIVLATIASESEEGSVESNAAAEREEDDRKGAAKHVLSEESRDVSQAQGKRLSLPYTNLEIDLELPTDRVETRSVPIKKQSHEIPSGTAATKKRRNCWRVPDTPIYHRHWHAPLFGTRSQRAQKQM